MKVDNLIVVDLPLSAGVVLSRPERVALKIEGAKQLCHIWQLAYTRREPVVGKPSDWPIDEGSFAIARRAVITRLISTVNEALQSKGWAGGTAFGIFRAIKAFTDWSDAKGTADHLWLSEEATSSRFLEYAAYLRIRVAGGETKLGTAAGLEQSLLWFCRQFFDEDFCRRFTPLKQGGKAGTRPPDEKELRNFRSVIGEIFDSACTCILENRPFPVRLVEAWEGKPVWYIPNGKSRATLLEGSGGAAWNIETGEVRTVEETLRTYAAGKAKKAKGQSIRAVNNALRIVQEVNSNSRHAERLNVASLGCLAFAAMFALQAGANQSVLDKAEFSDALNAEIRKGSVTRAKYRALKLRAGNKEITVSVGVGFMPKLARFLELRSFLLDGQTESSLFIYVGADGSPRPFSDNPGKLLKKRLARLGINTPYLGSRKLRAAKQDHVIRHESPDVAASMMGHSLATAMRVYSNGSAVRHATEMGEYLASVAKTVLAAGDASEGIPNAVGKCRSFADPIPIAAQVPATPNCRSTEGCLFCDKYRLHADETDVRKLFSCRFALRISFGNSVSPEFAKGRLSEVMKRIEELIAEVRTRDDALVKRVESEVDNDERLDPFWSAKIEQLALLGVI